MVLPDRILAMNWLQKLKDVGGRSIEDYQLRNRYFVHLITQCDKRKLLKPFDTPPAPGFQIADIKEFFVSPRKIIF
jgi:hypothetical protein